MHTLLERKSRFYISPARAEMGKKVFGSGTVSYKVHPSEYKLSRERDTATPRRVIPNAAGFTAEGSAPLQMGVSQRT
jgi:hypothetical protein